MTNWFGGCGLVVVGVVLSTFAIAGMRRSALAMKPLTIVGFEVAGTVARARGMLDTWGAAGQAAARTNIAWDFLFIPGYTMVGAGLALATLPSVAHAFGASAAPFALVVVVIAIPVIAAMADVAEDVLMLVTLGPGAPIVGVVKATRTLAVSKFGLLAAVFAWDLFVGVPAWIAGPHPLIG